MEETVHPNGRAPKGAAVTHPVIPACTDKTRVNMNQAFTFAAKPALNSSSNSQVKAWFYEMKGHSAQCVARYLELADLQEKDLKRVSTPCIDDHQLHSVDFDSKGDLEPVCSRIIFKSTIHSTYVTYGHFMVR